MVAVITAMLFTEVTSIKHGATPFLKGTAIVA
jgi:hypothetical protein